MLKRTIKITVLGHVKDEIYKRFTQKQAQDLAIEGVVQDQAEEGGLVIYACGPSDNLEKFIDLLYKGPSGKPVEDVYAEPFVKEKDYRGVFRIIDK